MKKHHLSHYLLLLSLLAVLPLLYGCHQDAEADERVAEAATPVRIAPVTRQATGLPIKVSGRLADKTEVRLSFKVGGVVDRVLVDEGMAVRQGQVLARLAHDEIDAQVTQARSAVDKAVRDHARMARLYRDSVVTLQQLQDTETALETVQAGLEVALFNRRYAVITAPSDGRVLRRMAEENELITPGAPVLLMGVASEGRVIRVGLADRDVVRLRRGDGADVTFDAYPGRTFSGRVTEIADAADPRRSTFEVEVAVADPEGLLKSGFVGTVAVRPSSAEPLYYLPIEALVQADGDRGVIYALDEDRERVRRVEIDIAALEGDALAVRTGLEAVTHVVTDGATYLGDGRRVEVVE